MEATTLSTALTEVTPFITKGFEFMTQAPMVYFIALGILGGAIGIFAKAKRSAK